jgi:HD-GYP domain-containing protein (c-di-GMP phosphodiesterase class II)
LEKASTLVAAARNISVTSFSSDVQPVFSARPAASSPAVRLGSRDVAAASAWATFVCRLERIARRRSTFRSRCDLPSMASPTAPAAERLAAAVGLHRDDQRTAVEARVATLIDALPAALELWLLPAAEASWRPLGPASAGPTVLSGNDAAIARLLRALPGRQVPQRAPLGEGYDAVVAPVALPVGTAARAAAIAVVPSSHGELARRTAELELRRLDADEQIEQLQYENRIFAQQISDDFEELTFLRIMASHLELEGSSLDPLKVVSQTLEATQRLIGAETLCYVERAVAASPRLAVRRPVPAQFDPAVESLLRAVVEAYCTDDRTQVLVRNHASDGESDEALPGLRQLLVVPVSSGKRRFGWFLAVNRQAAPSGMVPSPMLQIGNSEFGTWEASLLGAAATIVASHASNLELLREKEDLLVSVVRSFVSAIEAKDAYTRGHSERVARFAECVARQLGFEPLEVARLHLAALLHDVGKIGVSDAVLNKPGRLDPDEQREIERHPDAGWAILHDLQPLQYVLPGMLHHHERFDGRGYPDRLLGMTIPLDARILAVVDSYDAMTSDRAYRQGMSHERAVAILHEGAGTQWDAEVVAAFDAVVEEILDIRRNYRPQERPLRLGPVLGSVRDASPL